MSPPEWVLFQDLVLLKVLSHTPTFVIGEGESVLLEQGVYSRDASIPGILQVVKGQSPVLGGGFLPFESVFCPHTLGIEELRLP